MESETRLRAILRFVKRVALVEVALLALLGFVCWAAGWNSLNQYNAVVFWARAGRRRRLRRYLKVLCYGESI